MALTHDVGYQKAVTGSDGLHFGDLGIDRQRLTFGLLAAFSDVQAIAEGEGI